MRGALWASGPSVKEIKGGYAPSEHPKKPLLLGAIPDEADGNILR